VQWMKLRTSRLKRQSEQECRNRYSRITLLRRR
jgi:hypothetical protein